jgi:alkylation response protein AidB-like acyl-CoA dehydrogenase
MFLVPLKAKGVTIQPVYTFQDERTDITFYDGVHVPDSYRLGGVNEGSKTMSAGLEQEHGGGFSKVQRAMLKAAVQVCSEIRRDGRPSIEHTQAQVRLARSAADLLVSDLLTFRSIWGQREQEAERRLRPDGEDVLVGKIPERRARPARPDRSQFALESALPPYHVYGQSNPRIALKGAANARVTLLAGVTAVRDLGAQGYTDIALRDAVNDGDVPGPPHSRVRAGARYHRRHCDDTMLAPEFLRLPPCEPIFPALAPMLSLRAVLDSWCRLADLTAHAM